MRKKVKARRYDLDKIDIRVLRKNIGESQDAFGRRFGVNQCTVSDWEKCGFPKRGSSRKLIELVLADIPPTAIRASLRDSFQPASTTI